MQPHPCRVGLPHRDSALFPVVATTFPNAAFHAIAKQIDSIASHRYKNAAKPEECKKKGSDRGLNPGPLTRSFMWTQSENHTTRPSDQSI